MARSRDTDGGKSGASPESAKPSVVPRQASPKQAAPRVVAERPADISTSVDHLRTTVSDDVTAYVLIARLLSDPSHSGYGGKLGPSVEVGDAPEGAKEQAVGSWIEEVRPLFVPQPLGSSTAASSSSGLRSSTRS